MAAKCTSSRCFYIWIYAKRERVFLPDYFAHPPTLPHPRNTHTRPPVSPATPLCPLPIFRGLSIAMTLSAKFEALERQRLVAKPGLCRFFLARKDVFQGSNRRRRTSARFFESVVDNSDKQTVVLRGRSSRVCLFAPDCVQHFLCCFGYVNSFPPLYCCVRFPNRPIDQSMVRLSGITGNTHHLCFVRFSSRAPLPFPLTIADGLVGGGARPAKLFFFFVCFDLDTSPLGTSFP